MNKEAKIKLLQGINNGTIKPADIPAYLKTSGIADVNIVLWNEISPGVFQDDSGNEISNNQPFIESKPNQFNVKVIMFDKDGKPVPPLAHSEKEVMDRILLENNGSIAGPVNNLK